MTTVHPARFKLTQQIALPSTGSTDRQGCIQPFPWTVASAHKLFNGKWRASEQWSSLVAEFSDAVAVADGESSLYITHTRRKSTTRFILDATSQDAPQIAFALRTSRPFDPLIVVAEGRRIFVLNVRQKKFVAYLRGHGNRITSIAVHPTSPNIFATTSSDFTTRIYNLDLKVLDESVENPAWPPWDGPSHGSAAHGTDGSDSTGTGYGRCVQILVGGRSGGHSWDVLGAAFHRNLPLIATCGADRYVKIWRTLSSKDETVIRDDKPLFSARITTSRVLSIAWLDEDILLLHTATTYTPIDTGPDDAYGEEGDPTSRTDPGTLLVFQWLGLKRFFPRPNLHPAPVVRGGASDYQESKSYTVISTENLLQTPPEPISNISHASGIPGCFLLVYPHSNEVVLLNVIKAARKTLPPLNDGDIVAMTKKIRLDDSPEPGFRSPSTSARGAPFMESVLRLEQAERIVACALTTSGIIWILGSKGTIWSFSK